MNCEADQSLGIIHTVGPVYYSDAEKSPILLASCYRKCLDLAKQHSLTSIAFPSLSTGVYGYDIFKATILKNRYPIQEATAVAARAVRKWLDAPTDPESESSPPNSSVVLSHLVRSISNE
jgi:O-acetyl-ADP-ribose deacetylase (regulator of RNase III)